MPELPDVEVFSKYLRSTGLHKKILSAEVNTGKVLSGVSADRLKSTLAGGSLEETWRYGKYLFVRLKEGEWLLLHFGMTGRLLYFKRREKESGHGRLLIHFSNGYHLAYESRRMLGKVGLVENPASFIARKRLGPDALHLNFPLFDQILDDRRASIKSVLMDQKCIAGIGNVYSDEILFHAGIHPASKTGSLSRQKRKRIFLSMARVLSTAVDCKADPDRFPGYFLLPGRSEGERCPRCRSGIKKIRIVGRSSYYCPKCQRRYD